MNNTEELSKLLAKIKAEYPFVPHTNAGRLYSTVRRMKAEKEFGVPIGFRSGVAISTETGKNANEMAEQEWEKFYEKLRENLKRDYPDSFDRLFSEKQPELPVKEQTSDSSGRQSIPRSLEEIPVVQTTGWAIQFVPNKKKGR